MSFSAHRTRHILTNTIGATQLVPRAAFLLPAAVVRPNGIEARVEQATYAGVFAFINVYGK